MDYKKILSSIEALEAEVKSIKEQVQTMFRNNNKNILNSKCHIFYLKRYSKKYYLNHNNHVFFTRNTDMLYKVPLCTNFFEKNIKNNDALGLNNISINISGYNFYYIMKENKCRGITLVFPLNPHNIKFLIDKISMSELKDANIMLESEDNEINLKYTVEEFQEMVSWDFKPYFNNQDIVSYNFENMKN